MTFSAGQHLGRSLKAKWELGKKKHLCVSERGRVGMRVLYIVGSCHSGEGRVWEKRKRWV